MVAVSQQQRATAVLGDLMIVMMTMTCCIGYTCNASNLFTPSSKWMERNQEALFKLEKGRSCFHDRIESHITQDGDIPSSEDTRPRREHGRRGQSSLC